MLAKTENPFQNLKKDEIIDELEARGIDTYRIITKSPLQENLTEELHGICRPPALMLTNPQKSTEEHNIDGYEVMQCEPLPDICNVVQHIIEELPHHVGDQRTKNEFEKFS